MSTRRWPAWQALRTRVSMSATGSVILISCSVLLPTGFAHAGNFPAQRELAETNAAQPELAERPPAATAPLAPVIGPHLELRLPLDLLHPRLLRHPMSPMRPRRGPRPGRASPARAAGPGRCRPARHWSRA